MENGGDGDEHDHLAASIAVEPPLNETTPWHSFPRRDHKDDEGRLRKALRELKDLHSQLHHAADYCETAFLKTEQKNMVLENTKSYVCEALIAVVDHLGNVSSKLEETLDDNKEMVQAEQSMDSLNQRILTWKQCHFSLVLSQMQWNVELPRFQQRYALLLNQQQSFKSNELLRSEAKEASQVSDISQASQLELRVNFPQLSHAAASELAESVPVLDKPSLSPRDWSYYKFEDSDEQSSSYRKKPVYVNNFMSLLRVTKRKK